MGASIIQFIVYVVGIGIFCIVASSGGCSVSESRFKNVMKNEGYVKPVQGDYDFFECGYADWWINHFEAKRPTVHPEGPPTLEKVAGTVCCGIFKGCTVRWE